MSMYTDEAEGNTPDGGWVSLGERRKLRLHNNIHGEMVSLENAMMEEERVHSGDSSSHRHEENWLFQPNCLKHSDMTSDTSTRQLPEGGFFNLKQAPSNPGPRTLRNTGGSAKDKSREAYVVNHLLPLSHVEGLGSRYDNFGQRVSEKRAFHFMDMGPEPGYSIAPDIVVQASVRSEQRLDESAAEMNASTVFKVPVSTTESPDPQSSQHATLSSPPEPTIANPLSLTGQRIGTLLSIMRVPNKVKKITKGSAFNMVMEVGDVVKVLGKVTVSDTNGKDYLDYAVENLRTGARVIVAWSTFLPVGVREMCDCRGRDVDVFMWILRRVVVSLGLDIELKAA